MPVSLVINIIVKKQPDRCTSLSRWKGMTGKEIN